MKTTTIAILAFTFGIFVSAAYAEEGKEFTQLLGVHLGKKTRLLDVQKRFGQTPIVEKGNAGEYEARICYFVPKCGTTIEFWADDLGGPEHNLTGFTLVRGPDNPSQCLFLDLEDCNDLHLPRAIRLGLNRHEFIQALGGKVEVRGDRIYRIFEWRQLMKDEERRALGIGPKELSSDLYWDFVVSVSGNFESDVLQSVSVYMTQTF